MKNPGQERENNASPPHTGVAAELSHRVAASGLDTNDPTESTLRFVDALTRADEDFDLLVIPDGGHGMGGPYGQRPMQDFFVRHLLGIEPPDRNCTTATAPSRN